MWLPSAVTSRAGWLQVSRAGEQMLLLLQLQKTQLPCTPLSLGLPAFAMPSRLRPLRREQRKLGVVGFVFQEVQSLCFK